MKIGSLIKLKDSWLSVNLWDDSGNTFATASSIGQFMSDDIAIVVESHKGNTSIVQPVKILINDRCGWVSTYFIEEVEL